MKDQLFDDAGVRKQLRVFGVSYVDSICLLKTPHGIVDILR
jgi:hypothetical protein